MFSAVHSVLLRELPYQQAENVIVLRRLDSRNGTLSEGASAANMRDLAGLTQSLSHVAVANTYGFNLAQDGKAISLRGWVVSKGFFEAIGGKARLGRTFLPEELEAGGERVVVLSHHTWQSRFGGDFAVVGQELILDGAAHVVVGVMPEDFKYPSAAELWAPRPPQPWDTDLRATARFEAVARLRPDTRLAEAQAEIDRIAMELAAAHPRANAHLGYQALPLRQHLFGDVRAPLIMLFGAVFLVLLIAASNVAALQLARGSRRAREFALRGALGANSRRLLRLATTESLLLALFGGASGVGLAHLGVRLIRFLAPAHLPRIDELAIDGQVLLFALLVAISSAIAAGIGPTLQASRTDLNVALTEGSRGSTRGPSSGRLQDRLVVAQIALAVTLTIGAGLLSRSFDRLLDTELGFEPAGRLALQVFAYDDNHQPKVQFFEQAAERIGSLPGVAAIGMTTDLPMADDQSIWSAGGARRFVIADRTTTHFAEQPLVKTTAIDHGYAEALAIELASGRHLSALDDARAAPVAMVNEAFVRRYLPSGNAVGQGIQLFGEQEPVRQIVGVLADVRRHGFESEPQPELFVPLAQNSSGSRTFVVAATTQTAGLIAAVQQAIWDVDPTQPIWAARSMTDLLADWNRQRKFVTVLLVAFAALALALATIGMYGLMSFSVEQRVQELGIRRALGGQVRDVLGMVLGRGLRLALVGLTLGLVGSAVLSRWLHSLLFGIKAFDPPTFVAISALVLATTLLACLVPARRAMRVDPMAVLRAD